MVAWGDWPPGRIHRCGSSDGGTGDRQQLGHDSFVVDAGEVTTGWARLQASAPQGTEISLTYGERRHDDGTVGRRPGPCKRNVAIGHVCRRASSRQTLGTTLFLLRISVGRHRGLAAVDRNTLEIDKVRSAVDPESPTRVTADVDRLEEIHDLSPRSVANNLRTTPTDSPTYEKHR